MSQTALDLPAGLDQAFGAVAGELGQSTSAWLFVRAVARCAGDRGVEQLADTAGAQFVVLEAVARGWLAGVREQSIDARPAFDAIGSATRLVVVGVEAAYLDALVARIDPTVKIALMTHSPFPVDWDRVLDNYGGRDRKSVV